MRWLGLFLGLTISCGDDESSSSVGAGGASTGGGGGSEIDAGGGTGGGSECPAILITDGTPAECSEPGALTLAQGSTTDCTADSGMYWPAKVFAVSVGVGDCLHMRADNVGSPAGADLFGAVVDPGGKSLLFDEEADCTVLNPQGYLCPEGGTTVEAAGVAYVIVGAWEGEGCPAEETTPFELAVSVNGVDVDLSTAEVCAADLLEVIP
jgi:hypothetical protein